MIWVKALLVLCSLSLGYADLVTTNVILHLGLGELNPFMRLAQTSFGVWWLVPKLSLTFVVAYCSTPVINNLIIIAGTN